MWTSGTLVKPGPMLLGREFAHTHTHTHLPAPGVDELVNILGRAGVCLLLVADLLLQRLCERGAGLRWLLRNGCGVVGGCIEVSWLTGREWSIKFRWGPNTWQSTTAPEQLAVPSSRNIKMGTHFPIMLGGPVQKGESRASSLGISRLAQTNTLRFPLPWSHSRLPGTCNCRRQTSVTAQPSRRMAVRFATAALPKDVDIARDAGAESSRALGDAAEVARMAARALSAAWRETRMNPLMLSTPTSCRAERS